MSGDERSELCLGGSQILTPIARVSCCGIMSTSTDGIQSIFYKVWYTLARTFCQTSASTGLNRRPMMHRGISRWREHPIRNSVVLVVSRLVLAVVFVLRALVVRCLGDDSPMR